MNVVSQMRSLGLGAFIRDVQQLPAGPTGVISPGLLTEVAERRGIPPIAAQAMLIHAGFRIDYQRLQEGEWIPDRKGLDHLPLGLLVYQSSWGVRARNRLRRRWWAIQESPTWTFLGRHVSLISFLCALAIHALMGGLVGVGILLVILVHEFGHIYVLRRQKMPFHNPYFLPLVGAIIPLTGKPRNSLTEALFGLGGPLAGTLCTLVLMLLTVATESRAFQLLALLSGMLNLFNLIPMVPFDGGRAFQILGRPFRLLGCVLGLGVSLIFFRGPLVFIWGALGVLETKMLFRQMTPAKYYDHKWWTTTLIMGTYLLLVVVLVLSLQAHFVNLGDLSTLLKDLSEGL